MTQEEWTKLNRKAIQNIVQNNRPLQIAARTAMKDIVVRVFTDGKKTDGSLIGHYDTTKPMYVNPDLAPRATANKIKGIEGLKPTKGKHGDHTFKNGKEHKTTYVKSYSDFRKKMGRKVDKVNLVLSGDLQLDFSNGKVSNPTPLKVSTNEYVVGLARDENKDKREGLENKYGTIFFHTKEEIAKFEKIASLELKNEFSKLGLK